MYTLLCPPPESQSVIESRLVPRTRLAYADLHNHTSLSDGAGDPGLAFASMRSAGLHVAALTDHATATGGIDEQAWEATAALADAADVPGTFTAIRGFEWTGAEVGHANVWLSEAWTRPRGEEPDELYHWLREQSGIAGFNHPGRESGRFAGFAYRPWTARRLVTLEIFNRRDEYLFVGCDRGLPSPLVECLGAGWRVGLIGVSDEHGTDWGHERGKGRAGLWVKELSRRGVRAALLARRAFATVAHDLRLDAAATPPGGRPVPMGGTVRHRRGPLEIAVELQVGGEVADSPLQLQVLRPGPLLPVVVHAEDVRVVPGLSRPIRLAVNVDEADGGWLVLRVADPAGPPPEGSPAGHPAANQGLAYTSPWWLMS